MTLIEDFATGVQALMDRPERPEGMLDEVARLARPLVEDQRWIEPACFDVDEDQGIGIRVFHEGPDSGLLVQTVCWLPGRGVKPHDHQTWGVVVGLSGLEKNTSWRRLDDGGEAGHAELEVARIDEVGRGDFVKLRKTDIHSVENTGDVPSLSLHVYGRNIGKIDRWEYDPDAETVRPCPKRKRTKADA